MYINFALTRYSLFMTPILSALRFKFYFENAKTSRNGDDIQLFFTYAGVTKRKHFAKQWILKWLVETIKWVYAAYNLAPPQGFKDHQCENKFLMGRLLVLIQIICNAATWASSRTFAKYYRLNLAAKICLDFGRRVLVSQCHGLVSGREDLKY